MPSVKITIRFQPSHYYEITKIAEYFKTTPSAIIRYAISDYIDIFKIWRGRVTSIPDHSTEKSTVDHV